MEKALIQIQSKSPSDLDEFIGWDLGNDCSEPPEEEKADEARKDARGVGHLKTKKKNKKT